jgi:hypothetical protein
MAKQIQLTIPQPCHEGWETMSPSEKGRYCSSCQKQVIDFSTMSDRQLAEFFKKPIVKTGSVCGHFAASQLDRSIEIPKKRIPWVRYFFQVALPAFLVSLKASGQKTSAKTTTVSSKPACTPLNSAIVGEIDIITPFYGKQDSTVLPVKKQTAPETNFIKTIKGVVTDEFGQPLAHATVMIKGTNIGVAADNEGRFVLRPGTQKGFVVVQASYVGFETMQKNIVQKDSDSVVFRLKEAERFYDGFVVFARPAIKREIKDVPLMPANTTQEDFRVFPNPAAPGAKISIDGKKLKEGVYKVSLFNQAGTEVYYREGNISEEVTASNWALDLPLLPAGTYFILLVQVKTGKQFSSKLLIQ